VRIYLSFILAIMLSLNAAYTAAAGICDVLEHSSNHAAHFGHHSHEHSDDRAVQPAGQNKGDKVPPVSNQHHDHVHPGFSSILPCIISVMPLAGCSPQVAYTVSTFVSAQQALLDRPPRATLA